MCGRCSIITYDEVLGVIRAIEVGAPLNIEPDWPARRLEAFPKSTATLIIPAFDTADFCPSDSIGAFDPIGLPAADREGLFAAPGRFRLPKGSLFAQELSWGFEESWKQGVVFNTRIESAHKPTWADSMAHRRCVIPVPSFFETHRTQTRPSPKTGRPVKQPYEFSAEDGGILLIGCIWRNGSFSMVTTEANDDMAPIHHRMPLIVRPEELPCWLGPDYRALADRSCIRLRANPV